MNKDLIRNQEKVVKMVQELLLDEEVKSSISPSLISQKIEMVLAMTPRWAEGLDREAVIEELIRRFSLWIGQDTMLSDDTGHIHWLTSDRKTEWRYWRRYQEFLERKMSPRAVEALDESTDSILGQLEDPMREGPWDRRGLVVGHVQSGKTGNYTGLICKAADAGYKVIIVLAGLHNNLRSQTQIRLDEGFLGYETRPNAEDLVPIGVGLIDSDPSIRPNHVTNRSERGDFTAANSRNLGITPEERPWLFVVKKNKTPLEKLFQWIRNHVADTQDPVSGRKVVTKLPLLVIDDEADHASVDTGEQPFDDQGRPDEEHSPTAINSRIRKILNSFSRSAYVGYTATPFANIFIHERGTTREEGPDLFPSAFIRNLAAPSTHVGPQRVFGIPTTEGRKGALPLVRIVSDQASSDGRGGWMPLRHQSGHSPRHEGRDELPPSLIQAIDAFLLSCAERVIRGQGAQHSSMLIHVTRFVGVQAEVHRQVDEHVRKVRQRILRKIDDAEILSRLESLWREDFQKTTEAVIRESPDLQSEPASEWDAVCQVLPTVLGDLQVRMVNGSAKDALDYSETGGAGLKVIAIGGDKLSRGLTLEGLCVSYFLRASKMYDTLMQMGRWFGYRPGYLDLCRLYTTSDLVEWFAHIADASEELREEFDRMVAVRANPREYGLKVQSHPSLLVTSRLKMRAAKTLLLSFSGRVLETIVFHKDKAKLEANVNAVNRLLERIGKPGTVNPKLDRVGAVHEWDGYLWAPVPAGDVIDFLLSFDTHRDAYKVNGKLLADFVKSMNEIGELTEWTVAFIGGGSGRAFEFGDGLKVVSLKRQDEGREGKYSIGRLLSPRDEAIDLDESAWKAALADTVAEWEVTRGGRGSSGPSSGAEAPNLPSGPSIRKIRGSGAHPNPGRGLLLLYALDPEKAGTNFEPGAPAVMAFGLSFPASDAGRKVPYVVNNVAWEQEYGAAD